MSTPTVPNSAAYNVKDKVVLCTGANRGIGEAFVRTFLKRGARKIYVAVRNLDTAKKFEGEERVTPLYLDLSKPESIVEAAALAQDVEIVISNAGVLSRTDVLSKDTITNLQREMSVNVYGLIHMAQQFAPILQKSGGGVFVQINSVASFRCALSNVCTYSASKAAAYSITQALRQSMRTTRVISVHPGPIATDMILTADEELAKTAEDPIQVAEEVVRAIETPGVFHVYPDSKSKQLSIVYQPFASTVIEQGKLYG
jgi:NAD(P)-dependent dehydrogenase (short-subunit alcohol dehydrogenase family)